MVLSLLNKLNREHQLSSEEVVEILTHMDDASKRTLFSYAHETRLANYGNSVFVRGLIEFSNICMRNCLYCGLRAGNRLASRYRLTVEEILRCCEEGYEFGYRTFVLQSGEDAWFTAERMADLVYRIKESHPDVAVTLSIGERSHEEYRLMFDAGADRFLMRHETASPELYQGLHPGMSFVSRVRCLYDLKAIGYQVGAGFMVGLPRQTVEDLAQDLLFLKELEPDMIGIGPFIPHSQTPLAHEHGGTLDDTLIMIALARLFVPDALMPATTAMGTLSPQGREMALQVGANVFMPNLSPASVRPKYQLYDNKICTGDDSAQCRMCTQWRIELIGLEIDMGRGDSLRYRNPKSGVGSR